ncbi:hypothetical protein CONLIGDRAFT_708928 [Coniochaeta ligniaria NRRL 30616]|uniref:Methyltransferase domain-containing protein n=1 Tax=Coniochaeta ligniaria NRRL 30616 TaxID=1408157 RepID=A0A1J7JEM8_9PEZI|nr:hypothetical protein CONLIGDRAFT_708928 [Coniochaeta ligniaria NRRL 30616]
MPHQANLAAIGSKDRTVGWYDPPLTSIDGPIRDLLENYSHIPANEVVPRIIETVSTTPPSNHPLPFPPTPSHSNTNHPRPSQRDKIWDVFPWPCVGQFRFTDLSLSRKPCYPRVLAALKTGTERLLDVGCCYAQDLRKLAYDGAPSEALFGLDKQNEFIGLGYDFFNDRDTFRGTFINADLLDRGNEEVRKVQGTFGIAQLGMVLHTWDLEGQTRACERVVELLRPERGVLVVGQSVGDLVGKEFSARGKMLYKHDVETLTKMWEEVGRRTGTEWVVRATLDEGLGINEQKRGWDEPSTRRLSFEVERVRVWSRLR